MASPCGSLPLTDRCDCAWNFVLLSMENINRTLKGMGWLYLSFLVFLLSLCRATLATQFPYCSSLILDDSGEYPDFEAMLYNCSAQMPSPWNVPSTLHNASGPGHFSPTNIAVQLALNNLISVVDESTIVSLDFIMRLRWTDPRWVLPPEAWALINPAIVNTDGLSLTLMAFDAGTPLPVWKPDVRVQEAKEMKVMSNMLRLFPDGVLYWSRHVVVDLMEPLMDFAAFPNDVQNFSMTFTSYGYSAELVTLSFFADGAVRYSYNAQNSQQPNIEKNQLWTYQDYSAYTQTLHWPSFANPNRAYVYAHVNMRFARQSKGLLIRFAVPLLILMLLVGLLFWAELPTRIEATLQVLLVVAAIYLLLGETIPMVGYLTSFDNYVSAAFALLAVAVAVHAACVVAAQKNKLYPMNEFATGVALTFLRAVWMPLAMGVFFGTLSYYSTPLVVMLVVLTVGAISYTLTRGEPLKHLWVVYHHRMQLKAAMVRLGMRIPSQGCGRLKLSAAERLAVRVFGLSAPLEFVQRLWDAIHAVIEHDEQGGGVSAKPVDPAHEALALEAVLMLSGDLEEVQEMDQAALMAVAPSLLRQALQGAVGDPAAGIVIRSSSTGSHSDSATTTTTAAAKISALRQRAAHTTAEGGMELPGVHSVEFPGSGRGRISGENGQHNPLQQP